MAFLSSTRHYATITNQLLTKYSGITHSLALSLALEPHRLRHLYRKNLVKMAANVRELQNAVERAVILSQRGPLQFELPQVKPHNVSRAHKVVAPPDIMLTRDELKRRERESIAAGLKQTGGKIFGAGGAAELLGMKPTTLASRIKALGLNRKSEQ